MDNSTENVNLAAVFINDVLDIYKQNPSYHQQLSEMVKGQDISEPFNMVPIDIYNNMCGWIESQIGQANTRRVGRQIGKTAFEGMKASNLIGDNPTIKEVMDALCEVAQKMISDPKKRGWDILESDKKHMILRRTQTFNSTLQLGLLEELAYCSNVIAPRVQYVHQVEEGDEFDEYKITWLG